MVGWLVVGWLVDWLVGGLAGWLVMGWWLAARTWWQKTGRKGKGRCGCPKIKIRARLSGSGDAYGAVWGDYRGEENNFHSLDALLTAGAGGYIYVYIRCW